MTIPASVVSVESAFAYIAGRLEGFSALDDVTEFPELTAEAVAECVAIAKHFMPQYRMAPHEHSGYEIGSGGPT